MRDAAINIRVQAEQRDLIDHAASVLGRSRSDFMLEAACDRARAVLLDQTFFAADAGAFERFSRWLDEPPVPNPGLDRLMSLVPPWQGKTSSR